MARRELKKRLLVIDDDPSVLFAFQRIFSGSNILLDTTESLDHAKELIDSNYYQFIITDLGFSETVKEAGILISRYAKIKLPQVKIILWTGMEISLISEKVKKAKIDLCLPKPVPPNTIKSIVEKMCAKPSRYKRKFSSAPKDAFQSMRAEKPKSIRRPRSD